MNVLLSIKPEYVNEIITGNKKYEFRRTIFKRNDIENVYIYSTAPEKKIVGFFKLGKIISDDPETLWENLKEASGIKKEDFFKYFNQKNVGFAIEIQELNIFSKPKHLESISPPQSFCYIEYLPELLGDM